MIVGDPSTSEGTNSNKSPLAGARDLIYDYAKTDVESTRHARPRQPGVLYTLQLPFTLWTYVSESARAFILCNLKRTSCFRQKIPPYGL